MLNPFWPVCPRLHHGVMISDPCGPGPHAREWVCRTCGTRLYPTSNGGAAPAAVSNETSVTNRGWLTQGSSGKPREAPAHYGKSKERDRSHIGKWYE